ncbi:MAG: MogA/MoaB family molybdenum cofactor biosynthesis protein [Halovenus sp.]
MSDDHHSHDVSTVGTAVLTVSSTRTLETDAGGDAVVAALEAAGHTVVARDLVTDDEQAIRARVEQFVSREDVSAVVTTGGTGLTPDDVTVEAVRALFDRGMPGFGERFRARSVDDVGPRAMLSRATAGVSDGVVIFSLPGSEGGARFGTSELIAPVLGHAVGLLGNEHTHSHGHHEGDDHE